MPSDDPGDQREAAMLQGKIEALSVKEQQGTLTGGNVGRLRNARRRLSKLQEEARHRAHTVVEGKEKPHDDPAGSVLTGTIEIPVREAAEPKQAIEVTNREPFQAPWMCEPFAREAVEPEGSPTSSPIRGEVHGDIEGVKRDFRTLITKICTQTEPVPGETVRNAIRAFIGQCRKICPSFVLSVDLDQCELYEVVKILSIAFEMQICVLKDELLHAYPSTVAPGATPLFLAGKILGGWRKHPCPIGGPVWSATMAIDEGTAGYCYHCLIFWDPKIVRKDSDQTYGEIMEEPQNAFEDMLQVFFWEGRLGPEQYHRLIRWPLCCFEELEHAYDGSYREAVWQILPPEKKIIRNELSMYALPTPTSAFRKVRETGDEQSFATTCGAINEFAGQTGAAINIMKQYIKAGNRPLAYAVFLNYMAMERRMYDATQIASSATDKDAPYRAVAVRLFKDIDVPDTTDSGILRFCHAGDDHPADVGLALLEGAYRKNIRTLEDRRRFLHNLDLENAQYGPIIVSPQW